MGWEHQHVAIDDASRLPYTVVLPQLGQRGRHRRSQPAVRWFGRLGVTVERIMTDNSSAKTSLREWAYAQPYETSEHRKQAIGPWTDDYNLNRPHSAIGGKTPFQRLNNLLGKTTRYHRLTHFKCLEMTKKLLYPNSG